MSLASPTKQADLECFTDCAEILESTYRAYQKAEGEKREKLMEYIEEQVKFLDWLREKIEKYDYSEDDKWYWRIVGWEPWTTLDISPVKD